MKILLANKFYYRRGGDCVHTLNLEQLLKAHGHEVAVFAMDYPENLETQWSKYFPSEVKFKLGTGMIEALMRPFGTREVQRKFNALLDDFHPDVVHLNNIHSQLSPVIAEMAHERGIKVVWTLHDYKLLCPRYDCLRNGETVCESCFADKHKVLEYKCMKNSKVASFLSYEMAPGALGELHGRFRLSFTIYARQDEAGGICCCKVAHIVQFYRCSPMCGR